MTRWTADTPAALDFDAVAAFNVPQMVCPVAVLKAPASHTVSGNLGAARMESKTL